MPSGYGFVKYTIAQQNKEEIAKLVVEDLSNSPPPDDSKGPSEDWLNKFERYAGDASSDDIQLLFARLLASEIRHEKSVSAALLHFASLLDEEVAELIDRVLPYTTLEGHSYIELVNPALEFSEQVTLEQAGFWSLDKALKISEDENGNFSYPVEKKIAVLGDLGKKKEVQFSIAILSKAGRELASVLDRNFDVDALGRLILRAGAEKVYKGTYVRDPSTGNLFIGSSKEIFL